MWDRTRRSGSKKSIHILVSPCGGGQKFCPIPVPPLLRGGENPCWQNKEGWVKWGWAKLPSFINIIILDLYFNF